MNMSITYFFLLLLCITMHVYKFHARHLAPVRKHEKETQLPMKDDEINNIPESYSSQLNKKLFQSKKKGETRTEGQGSKETSHKIPTDGKRTSNGKAQDNQLSASVSWRIPHKKKGKEKHTEFTMDYSPPRTHPPSHN